MQLRPSRDRVSVSLRFGLGLVVAFASACATPADDDAEDAQDALSKTKNASADTPQPAPPPPRDDWDVAREWARNAPNVSSARYTGEPTLCRGYRNGSGALGTGLFADVQFVGSGPTQLDALTSAFVQCKRSVFNQAPDDEYNQRVLCFTRHYVQCRNE